MKDTVFVSIWNITANPPKRERNVLYRLGEYGIPYTLRGSSQLMNHVEVNVPLHHANRARHVIERDFGRRN